MVNISFNSQINPLIVFGVAVIVIFSIYFTYRKREIRRWKMIAFLQIITAFFIILILFKPEMSFRIRKREKKHLYILVDNSLSMGIKNKEGISRFERVKEIIEKNKYFKKFNPVFFTFNKSLKKEKTKSFSPVKRMNNTTEIFKNIKEIENTFKEDCSGILLFTDGQESTPVNLEKIDIPVFAVGMGGEETKDISITGVISNSPVFSGDKLKISVYETHYTYGGKETFVYLKRNGKVIKRKKVKLKGNSSRVDFEIEVSEGVSVYEIYIEPFEDEVITENNKSYLLTRVISPEIKILYVEGYLRWEYKYLKRFLERDIKFQPVFVVKIGPHLFQQTGGEKVNIEKGIFTEDVLRNFNIVVIGDIDFSLFSQKEMESFKKFVEVGGSVIFLGGKNFLKGCKNSPIEEILPVYPEGKENEIEEGKYIPIFTDIGENIPVFSDIDTLPPLTTINILKKVKEEAKIILKGKFSLPLMLEEIYGKGKIILLATDSTWKWFLSSKESRKKYELFWGRVFYYLCPPEEYIRKKEMPRIFLKRKNYSIGEEVEIEFEGEEKRGKFNSYIIMPDGKIKSLEVKNNKAKFVPEKEGFYLIKVSKGKFSNWKGFFVKATGNEFRDYRRNKNYLEKLAKISGGFYLPEEEAGKIGKILKPATKKIIINAGIGKREEKFLIIFVFILLSVTWFLRRKEGII